ncbi:hypothetical protein AB837_00408 [bacterium AB1]|nr:hypothetical protein AB837_00408 [bacterium AB1]
MTIEDYKHSLLKIKELYENYEKLEYVPDESIDLIYDALIDASYIYPLSIEGIKNCLDSCNLNSDDRKALNLDHDFKDYVKSLENANLMLQNIIQKSKKNTTGLNNIIIQKKLEFDSLQSRCEHLEKQLELEKDNKETDKDIHKAGEHKDFEEQISQLTQKHQETTERLEQIHIKQVSELEKKHQEKTTSLEQEHKDKTINLEQKHKEKITEVEKKHKEKITEVEKKYTRQISELEIKKIKIKDENSDTVDSLKEKINHAQNKLFYCYIILFLCIFTIGGFLVFYLRKKALNDKMKIIK